MSGSTNENKAVVFDVRRVYLKDVSFESPQAPEVFVQSEKAPDIDVQMSINDRRIDENYYEVVLNMTATAKTDGDTVFLVEVQQAGIFEIRGITGDNMSLAINVGCPTILLPFARETIANVVIKGGFKQLLINPVNFEAIYQSKLKQQAQSEPTGSHDGTTH